MHDVVQVVMAFCSIDLVLLSLGQEFLANGGDAKPIEQNTSNGDKRDKREIIIYPDTLLSLGSRAPLGSKKWFLRIKPWQRKHVFIIRECQFFSRLVRIIGEYFNSDRFVSVRTHVFAYAPRGKEKTKKRGFVKPSTDTYFVDLRVFARTTFHPTWSLVGWTVF